MDTFFSFMSDAWVWMFGVAASLWGIWKVKDFVAGNFSLTMNDAVPWVFALGGYAAYQSFGGDDAIRYAFAILTTMGLFAAGLSGVVQLAIDTVRNPLGTWQKLNGVINAFTKTATDLADETKGRTGTQA